MKFLRNISILLSVSLFVFFSTGCSENISEEEIDEYVFTRSYNQIREDVSSLNKWFGETEDTHSQSAEYTVSVTVRFSTNYSRPGALRVTLMDSNFTEISHAFDKETVVLFEDGEFTTTCKIPAGDYVIDAYNEIDSELCDFEFTNVTGGEVVFEYNGDTRTWSVVSTNFTDWKISFD